MGVPLLMEPNFADYSCQVISSNLFESLNLFDEVATVTIFFDVFKLQFKFGVLPPLPEDDAVVKEPCLEACPIASQRRMAAKNIGAIACPKT